MKAKTDDSCFEMLCTTRSVQLQNLHIGLVERHAMTAIPGVRAFS